jgi:hypothetical protein
VALRGYDAQVAAPAAVEMVDSSTTLVEWLTAGGTVLAVVVALAFGVLEFVRGHRQRAELRAERRISQAALVNAWLEVWIEGDASEGMQMLAAYRLHNASTSPVYSVVTVMPKGFWGGTLAPWGLLTPSDKPREVSEPRGAAFYDDSDVQLELTFRDAAGVWWRRTRDGLLHELECDPHGGLGQPPAS